MWQLSLTKIKRISRAPTEHPRSLKLLITPPEVISIYSYKMFWRRPNGRNHWDTVVVRTLFALCSLYTVQCSITNSFIMQNWLHACTFCRECLCWFLSSMHCMIESSTTFYFNLSPWMSVLTYIGQLMCPLCKETPSSNKLLTQEESASKTRPSISHWALKSSSCPYRSRHSFKEWLMLCFSFYIDG